MAENAKLFANGLIRTLDPVNPVVEAVLVREGRVAAVGALADLREQAGSNAEMVDLAGSTMLPGLIESHNHLQIAEIGFAHVNLRGDACDSIPEMQRLLSERTDRPRLAIGASVVAPLDIVNEIVAGIQRDRRVRVLSARRWPDPRILRSYSVYSGE